MKPILFNTAMVQAILDGRKTTTRRVIKIDGDLSKYEFLGTLDDPLKGTIARFRFRHFFGDLPWADRYNCQYKVGDILYVRETWFEGDILNSNDDITERNIVLYKTDDLEKHDIEEIKWRPSIHMPKRLARIFLRVKGVRVERLQDITEEGAVLEGAEEGTSNISGGPWGVEDDPQEWTALEDFEEIWNSTVNKKDIDKYGFDANPYVWAIEFERIDKSEVDQ